ncbi:type IV pilus assembly protein FimV [Halomonas sp. AOP13-D3-9]
MKKTLTWMTWLSLSAASPFALAIGLGQASVSSYLNAPLDASIPLLESSDYALDNIRVEIADPSDFATAGLEWTPLAASVRAQVVEYQGQRQVRLSSDQAMQEPWLDVLLTVEFPGGQQFRDITLLFDPQGYSQQGQSQQGLASAIVSPTAEARPAAPARARGGATGNARSAYIGSGDTLWSVAERIKHDDVSVQQMMIALLEANPDVFPSGNINDMRAGQTLAVPDAERILARSHADADTAIKAMNEAWRARRNGSLQAVSLSEVEAVPVADAAIAAAQTLQANGANQPDSALAAGGSEAVMPDGSEPDEPEALTRAELTEQLRLSQATLQQVLEERELMRAELNELRGEVASLTQALSEALAAQEQSPEPLAANLSETDSPGIAALIERYQWPLALAAIALLVALLVWLRKRREETWDDVPLVEPVVKPTVSPGASPKATSMPEAVPVTHPAQPNDDAVNEPRNDSGQSTAPDNEPEAQAEAADAPATNDELPLDTDQWLVDDQAQTPVPDNTLRYEKSQASGLAEQGRQRRLGLHAVATDSSESVSLAPPPSTASRSQLLASIGTASEPAAAAQPTEKPSVAAEDPGHRFIDYHPPILNSAANSSSNSFSDRQDGPRIETPMQPTVEFTSEPHAEPVPTAKHPRRPVEEEWEIEEVAFKPRGLDNSDPSKSSK